MTTPRSAEDKHTQLAALIIFTTKPTDRALHGWNGKGWIDTELRALGIPALLVAGTDPRGGLE